MPELCTESEVAELVDRFYSRVRADRELGPVFAAHVDDWSRHLPKMVDFWSSALRKTARYRGTPMPTHAALPNLSAALFRRWLDLFHETTGEQSNEALRLRADELAERVAQSLWYGYQMHRDPGRFPSTLPAAGHALASP